MIIKVNGSKKELVGETTVAELLVICEVKTPEYVTVQLNGNFLNQGELAVTTVKEGDQVEFMYFMGGGAIVLDR